LTWSSSFFQDISDPANPMKIKLNAILSSLVTAACLSVGTAGTAHAQNDLFASVNGGSGNAAGFI
jgi:hypothetical protein